MYVQDRETRLMHSDFSDELPGVGKGELFQSNYESSNLTWALVKSAVIRHFWRILGGCFLSLIVAFILSKNIPAVYEATTTLEINPERPSELLGPDAVRTAWNDADQYIATQLRVIQEDSVLRPVVDQFHIQANADKDPNAPIVLKGLQVVRPPNTYLIQISYRSRDRVLAAKVSNGIALSYLHHVFQKKLDDRNSQTSFMESQLDGLKIAMDRSTQAVNEFERKLGVVDPQEKTNIVSARLMQLNTEYTNAQADRIRRQADYEGLKSGSLSAAQQSEQGDSVKRLQTLLEAAQQKFTEVREHFGLKHPEYEKQKAIVEGLEGQVDQARKDVAARALVAFQDAQQRESILEKELAEAKAAFDDLNAKSYQYQALRIEAENNRKLYDGVEQRVKEAGINGTFQSGMTHISDSARPPLQPLYPRIKLNLSLALALSLIIGLTVALLVEATNDKIRGAEEVQTYFHTDVLGVIPQILSKPKLLAEPVIGKPLLAAVETSKRSTSTVERMKLPSSLYPVPNAKITAIRLKQYEESLRMLWSSFQLTCTENTIRSLMVTSAMPEEGKTTITMQIAAVHAMHDYKTLVIDADLRRPGAHRLAAVPNSPGLADIARTDLDWRDCVVQSPNHRNLFMLPAGTPSARSFDDIVRMMPSLVAEAEPDYDLVLVDAPPLLSFSESLHIASAVGGVMIVVCADQTSRRALSTVLQTLHRVRATVLGVAINKVGIDQQPDSYKYLEYYDHAEAV